MIFLRPKKQLQTDNFQGAWLSRSAGDGQHTFPHMEDAVIVLLMLGYHFY